MDKIECEGVGDSNGFFEVSGKTKPKIYDVPQSCNYCSGVNEITVTDSLEGHMHECKTTCNDCGKHDYWATGFFMSSEEIVGKCKKY